MTAPLTLADVAEQLRAMAADLDRRQRDLDAMATAELWTGASDAAPVNGYRTAKGTEVPPYERKR